MDGNGCVSECLYNAILVRRLRAWPAMSAITTSSGSTCPSHQESAWGAAEARQERVIVEVVTKGIVVGKCWSMCWTHLQMFSVSTVLRDKASDVEQSLGSSAKLPGPSHTSTLDRKRTSKRRHHVWWVERFAVVLFSLFSFFVFEECAWVDGNGCVSEWLYNAILVRRLWTVEKDV